MSLQSFWLFGENRDGPDDAEYVLSKVHQGIVNYLAKDNRDDYKEIRMFEEQDQMTLIGIVQRRPRERK